MNMTMRTGWMIVAAVAAAMPALVQGQYQIDNSTGRMLDANNRLGSRGVNDGRTATGGYNADDIVYGNVTRGRQFRGPTGSTDASAFRGGISRPSDNLVRDAGPSAYQQGGINAQFTGQRFYGEDRGVRPPEGFQQLTPGSTGAFEVQKPTYRTPGDVRMDDTIPSPDMSLPRPSQYIIPNVSPMDTTTANTAIPEMRVNPQVRRMDMEYMPSRDLLRRLNLDEGRIREMRDELRRAGEEGTEAPRDPNNLSIAPETPVNEGLNSAMKNELTAKAISGDINTQQSHRQTLLTVDPLARQNSQYAALRQRLDRFNQRQGMSDEEAARQFQQEWQAAQERKRQQDEAAVKPTVPMDQQPMDQKVDTAAKLPDATEEDQSIGQVDRRRMAMMRQQQQGDANKVEGILPPQPDIPLKISSFAEGVKATGLKKLLTDAEVAMRKGDFTNALDQYDGAAAVAPNQPLIMVGRAIAELGAGYYARAQIHLEQALSMDPALLMARYDLKAFYGEDRLKYVTRDLKDLAQAESRQARPLFLLAFIAYSTESEQRAADFLNLAEQRGGSKEFHDKLREYWKLNEKKEGAAAPAPAAAPAGTAPVTPDANR